MVGFVSVSVSEGQTNRVPWALETRLGVVDRPVDIAMSPWSVVYIVGDSAALLAEFTTSVGTSMLADCPWQ